MTRNETYLGLVLVGATIGAVAGLLLAPAPGRETRRKLARRIVDEKDAAARSSRRAIDYVQERVAEGRERLARVTAADIRKGWGAA